MTLAVYTRATEAMQTSPQGLFLSRLLTRLRKGASAAPPNFYIFRYLQGF
jgi:hypothetical protein